MWCSSGIRQPAWLFLVTNTDQIIRLCNRVVMQDSFPHLELIRCNNTNLPAAYKGWFKAHVIDQFFWLWTIDVEEERFTLTTWRLPSEFTRVQWSCCFNFPGVFCLPQAWRGWRTLVTPATWTPPSRPCPTGETRLSVHLPHVSTSTCLPLNTSLSLMGSVLLHVIHFSFQPFNMLQFSSQSLFYVPTWAVLVDCEKRPWPRSFRRVVFWRKLLQCSI